MSPIQSENDTAPASLQCMNVWCGNGICETDFSVTGMDVSVRSTPWHGEKQGGDIYLVSMCACASISRYILADVSGHGVAVAPLTQRLRKLMYKHINHPDQTYAAQALNREFTELRNQGRFATALLLTYLPENDHLIICNAGHPPPLWYKHSTKTWQWVENETKTTVPGMDLPLGVLPGTTYQQSAIQLEHNDRIVFFSDGLTEAQKTDETQLGMEGFCEAVVALNAEAPDFATQIMQTTSNQHCQPDDDQTVVVLRHNGSAAPAQSLRERISAMTRLIGVKAGAVVDYVRDKAAWRTNGA